MSGEPPGVPPKYQLKLSDICHAGRLPRRAEKSDKMGSRWGRIDRREIQQNPHKIPFFKAFARREHCSGGVEFSGGYDGRRCRMQNEIATAPARPRNDGSPLRQLADRDDSLPLFISGPLNLLVPEGLLAARADSGQWFRLGLSIRGEGTDRNWGCRSPGARES